jgi:hypothetical protein
MISFKFIPFSSNNSTKCNRALTHETRGVANIGADFAINLDQTLSADGLDFLVSQGILQTVTNENDQGQRFTELVGTSRGSGSLLISEFIEVGVS